MSKTCRNSLRPVIAALCLTAAIVQPAKAVQQSAELSEPQLRATGVVRGPDGQPVANADVLLCGPLRGFSVETVFQTPPVLQTRTDAGGAFSIDVPDKDESDERRRFLLHGELRLIVQAPELETITRRFEVTRLLIDLPFEVQLRAAVPFRVRVLDPDGKPLPGTMISPARVGRDQLQVAVGKRFQTKTGSDGLVELKRYRPDTMPEIYVESAEFGSQQLRLRKTDNGEVVAKMMPLARVQGQAILPEGTPADSLSGQRLLVFTLQNKTYVEGGPSSLSWAYPKIDESGHFRSDKVAPGGATVSLSRFASPFVLKQEFVQTRNLDIGKDLTLELEFVPSQLTEFTIVDETGKPLRDIDVRLPRAPHGDETNQYQTDSRGRVLRAFAKGQKRSGQLFLTDPLGRYVSPPAFGVMLNEIKEPTPLKMAAINMPRARTVSGTVIDSSQRAVAGATVQYSFKSERFNRELTTLSDRNGRFVIRGLIPDVPLQISAAKGFWMTDAVSPTQATADDRTNVELVLFKRPSASPTGIVVDQDGAPVAGLKVIISKGSVQQKEGYSSEDLRAVPLFDETIPATTDAAGRFIFPPTVWLKERLKITIDDDRFFAFNSPFLAAAKRKTVEGRLELGTFRITRRPVQKEVTVTVLNDVSGEPISGARLVFLGALTGNRGATTNGSGVIKLDLADTSQLVAVQADDYDVTYQSLPNVSRDSLTLRLTPTRVQTEERFYPMPWFERSPEMYTEVTRSLLNDLPVPVASETTFYRYFGYLMAKLRCDPSEILAVMADPDQSQKETLLQLVGESLTKTDPVLTAQATLGTPAGGVTTASMLARSALLAPDSASDTLFGEAMVAVRESVGDDYLMAAGTVAMGLALDGRHDEARALLRMAWDSDAASQLKDALRSDNSGERRERIGIARVFCPPLAMIEPNTAMQLIEVLGHKPEVPSLQGEAALLLALVDPVRHENDFRGQEIKYIGRAEYLLDGLPQRKLTPLVPWAKRMADAVSEPELRLRLLLLCAKGTRSKEDRDEYIRESVTTLRNLPLPGTQGNYWDPGRHFVAALPGMNRITQAQLDTIVFALLERAPDSYDTSGAVEHLANVVRMLAIRDPDHARHLLEPTLQNNSWLFGRRNRSLFELNHALRAAFWIDPEWGMRETRKLSDELLRENSGRPLELRAGAIEEAAALANMPGKRASEVGK